MKSIFQGEMEKQVAKFRHFEDVRLIEFICSHKRFDMSKSYCNYETSEGHSISNMKCDKRKSGFEWFV